VLGWRWLAWLARSATFGRLARSSCSRCDDVVNHCTHFWATFVAQIGARAWTRSTQNRLKVAPMPKYLDENLEVRPPRAKYLAVNQVKSSNGRYGCSSVQLAKRRFVAPLGARAWTRSTIF
jgi:hypothetical protein